MEWNLEPKQLQNVRLVDLVGGERRRGGTGGGHRRVGRRRGRRNNGDGCHRSRCQVGERSRGGGGAEVETAQQIALAARFLELGARRQTHVALQLLQTRVLLLQLLLPAQQLLVAQLERLRVLKAFLRVNAFAAGAVARVRSHAQQNFRLRGRLGGLFAAQSAASGGRRQVLAARLQPRRTGGGDERRLGAGARRRRGRHFAALGQLRRFVVVARRAHRRRRVGAARVRVQAAQRARLTSAAAADGRLGRRWSRERLQLV